MRWLGTLFESVLEEGAAFLATKHSLASLPANPKKLVVDFVNGGKSSFTNATLGVSLEAAIVEAVRAKTEGLKRRNTRT